MAKNVSEPEKPLGRLLTKTEPNRRLNLPDNSNFVYQQICRKKLPFRFVKVGKFLRFPESEVEAYLSNQLQSCN